MLPQKIPSTQRNITNYRHACTWSLCCSSHTTAALRPLTDISPALQSPSLPPLATITLFSASRCEMFMTARIWEQSKGLLTDEWIKKLWSVHVYTHSGVLFSLKKQGDPLNWHFSKVDIQMAKKHMEWCLAYLIIRETQIETTVRNHSTLAKMAIIKSLQTINAGEGVEKREPSCWWECKLVQPLWRTVWSLLKKLKVEPPKTQHSHSSAKTQRKP